MVGSRAKGRHRLIQEITVNAFSAVNNRFDGRFAVRRDLRHRAGRDEALALAHLEFRAVLAGLSDGVAVLWQYHVYFTNPAFMSLLQRESSEVIGRSIKDFVHPDDRCLLPPDVGPQILRLRLLRPDGGVRFVEITGVGSMSFEGTPTQVALIRDVTEQRVAEEHSAHGSRLAALGSMAASIGHEINNPLSYLIGNLEAALEEQDEQVRRQVLTEARDGARRIHQIVTDLRAFTRLDPFAPMEAVDVTSAVSAAVNLTGNQLRHRARLIRSHDADCVAWAKEGPLVQVLVNLLLNAAQSLSTDRLDHEVRVTSRRIGSEVVVEDTGVGIPPEVVPRIFEPFFHDPISAGRRRAGPFGFPSDHRRFRRHDHGRK